MNKLFLAVALLGFTACANTQKDTVGSAESASAPAAACSSACSTGGECCAEKAAACTAEKAAASGEVCPVTGKATN